jgi:hypothetical protein
MGENGLATKEDLKALELSMDGKMKALELRLEGRMDALEQRMTDRMIEAIRDTETKLLQAFYAFA